ncbi:MAG TPA: MFS transporter [Candidatus Binataceae bacterium]|nr:MFS transporter [Candidatus Binataceae bacterium]
MAEESNGRWLIVGTLFATLFLTWGPVNAGGVFFLPVVRHFGWSRAWFSALGSAAPLAAGLSSPLLGSLLDRIGARPVMIAGAAMVGAGYVALSRANSAAAFLVIFIVMGVGISASTIIPTALVITKWFQARRGAALGVAFAGIPLGSTVVTIWANYLVLHFGFRVAFFAMGMPILLIVIPLLTAFLRTRPGSLSAPEAAQSVIPGLEVDQALKSRSFWMIAIAEVLFATAAVGVRVHLVPYLNGIGYTPTVAAGIFGAMFIFGAIGSFAIGPIADRLGGRATFAGVFVAGALGIAALLAALHPAAVAAFLLTFGLMRETSVYLHPLAIGESLGNRRLGALLGIQAFFTTLGFAAGPVIAGRIFDRSGAYTGAWLLFAAMALVSAVAMRATLPFAQQRARSVIRETAAA